ncbi:MAG: helix-turn-helix domain-containing protein [bacterium]|nr:helix-turn-helix domain-containing protein [bacterium]
MKTVGETLKEAREAKGLSVEAVAATTRIPVEHILHLEQGEYNKLPAIPFVKGFIRNEAKVFGLPILPLYALYRREVDDAPNRAKVLDTPKPMEKQSVRLTPRSILLVAVIVTVLGFFGYLFFAYRSFVGAPLLLVQAPNDEQKVTTETVTVRGRADPDANVVINGQMVVLSKTGDFVAEIRIEQGITTLTIKAANKRGRESVVVRSVIRE